MVGDTNVVILMNTLFPIFENLKISGKIFTHNC